MRPPLPRTGRILAASWIAAAISGIALPAAFASEAKQTVHPGTLGITASDVGLPNLTLTGGNQSASRTSPDEWIARDARGNGNGWTVTLAAGGDMTSPPGSVEAVPRTLAISTLSFDPGVATAKPGSDSTANLSTSSVTLSTSQQSFLSCSSVCKGRYGFYPTLTLTVPANAFRSNYSGVVGGSSLNPYTVTLTFTIS